MPAQIQNCGHSGRCTLVAGRTKLLRYSLEQRGERHAKLGVGLEDCRSLCALRAENRLVCCCCVGSIARLGCRTRCRTSIFLFCDLFCDPSSSDLRANGDCSLPAGLGVDGARLGAQLDLRPGCASRRQRHRAEDLHSEGGRSLLRAVSYPPTTLTLKQTPIDLRSNDRARDLVSEMVHPAWRCCAHRPPTCPMFPTPLPLSDLR